MAKVIYIKANPKADTESVTFQVSEQFIAEYKKNNPGDEIITLDLYRQNIRFLDGDDLNNMFSGNDFDVRNYAVQFAEADKYVIAAPLWNLSMPAILKGYIDYITFAGITFKYTENGPVGLLANQNKKLIYIVARGGSYTAEPMSGWEMGERYLRTIMGFMGISDFNTIACELTNVLQGEERNNAVQSAVKRAVEAAKEF